MTLQFAITFVACWTTEHTLALCKSTWSKLNTGTIHCKRISTDSTVSSWPKSTRRMCSIKPTRTICQRLRTWCWSSSIRIAWLCQERVNGSDSISRARQLSCTLWRSLFCIRRICWACRLWINRAVCLSLLPMEIICSSRRSGSWKTLLANLFGIKSSFFLDQLN